MTNTGRWGPNCVRLVTGTGRPGSERLDPRIVDVYITVETDNWHGVADGGVAAAAGTEEAGAVRGAGAGGGPERPAHGGPASDPPGAAVPRAGADRVAVQRSADPAG